VTVRLSCYVLVSLLERADFLKIRSNNHKRAIASTKRSRGSIHFMHTSLSAMVRARTLPKEELLCLPRDTAGARVELSLIFPGPALIQL
jgi:hypothetical protein